jgi:hypothetical protein
MNCEEVEQQDIVGAYVAGKLPEELRYLFEEHYFGCDHCLHQVEVARIARNVLVARRPAKFRVWMPLLAVAAALIAGVVIWKTMTPKPEIAKAPPTPAPARNYQLLARFDAPPYEPANLRGSETVARSFRDAMKQYSAGDYAAAAIALRSTANTTEARFYLGLSELLSGDRAGGTADLERVITAGDTPFQSEARFYLAKALLGSNNPEGARQQLETLVKEKSELGPRATEILNQLSAAH